MAPDPGRDAADVAYGVDDDPRYPANASRAMAALRAIRLLDARAWRAARGGPFQFARWLSALAVVVVSWVQSGTALSAAAYVPVLAVVALLLLPDAQSIGVAGLRFERLTSELAQQGRAVDRLFAEVSLINNSLVAGSQVNITLGATAMDGSLVATSTDNEDSPAGRAGTAARACPVDHGTGSQSQIRIGAGPTVPGR